MEFENAAPVDDEARRLAESKKLTLTPLHDDVTPDPEPDGELVARHLNDPLIANSADDTEQNTTPVRPSKGLLQAMSSPRHIRPVYRSVNGRVVLLAALVIVLVVVGLLALATSK